MNRLLGWGGLLVIQLFAALPLWAGGSGLNVVIVVNQSSSNSVQLGNYYRERRHVPPQNVLRVNWSGGNVEWAESDLENTILNPLLTMLSLRRLTNQIDYVVLSMDFPYRVTSGSSEPNSTTASLFYGFKTDTNPPCSLATGSANLYFASEGIFRATPPISANSNSFLVTMITGTNLVLAKQAVDQGVLGDATFPTQTVLLGKSFDTTRNVRFLEFDNTVFDTRLRGNYSVLRTNINEPGAAVNLLGYENGIVAASIAANAFVAGSMADNLTSFSGDLFENTGHTTGLDFLQGGASGSYGTVTEPCNYLEKFPNSENYFYQARGFSLAECYYQSLANPYQGIMVGEPLSAPFAQPAGASWNGLGTNALLSGTTNLALQFIAADAQHPVQQVDLFLDGLWLQTVTNMVPRQATSLNVTLNGHATSYGVPAGATIKSVTSGLAAALNNLIYTNLTKVLATAYGDRIELNSTDGTKTGSQVTLSVSSSVSGAPLNTFVAASRSSFLDSIAWGYRSYEITVPGTLGTTDWLRIVVTKTNSTQVSLAVTNSSSGTLTQLAQSLVNLINATPGLQGTDGLAAEDFQPYTATDVVFNLRALGQGYAAAQIQANVTSSGGLAVNPAGNGPLTDNLSDLQPRNHIYVTAGATNLVFSFPLNTASLPDGYHELAAVAYEGSHVRTQAHATQQIVIQNTALSATLTALVGGSNTAVEATLQFSVSANTPNVSKIELFSTAGTIGLATNQSSATFSIAGTNLDLGLHPFYAVVTGTNGQQYRTTTLWFRLIGPEPPFALQVNVLPTTLTWLATAGRSYVIQTTTNLAVPFQLRDAIVPTNSLAQWVDTNSNATQLFYRVVAEP